MSESATTHCVALRRMISEMELNGSLKEADALRYTEVLFEMERRLIAPVERERASQTASLHPIFEARTG